MGWKENMRPASFRGAGFFIEATDGDVGRRLAIHEYPLQDLPYGEDLGRKARVFKLTGQVIGPDYMAKRDALLAACEHVRAMVAGCIDLGFSYCALFLGCTGYSLN
jgi:prophage DNA circulation protein